MTSTYLLRHGEVDNPDGIVYADLDGFGLSERGRDQVVEAGRRLPAGAAIVSSPLERAAETAAILGAGLDTSVTIDPGLTEWRLMNRWAGHRWATIDTDFPGELTAYLDHPERLSFSEESLGVLAERVATAVRRHRAGTAGALVIVSHQDPIQAARLMLTGRPLAELHHDKPGHAEIVSLDGDADGGYRPAT